MKKNLLFLAAAAAVLSITSCSDDNNGDITTPTVDPYIGPSAFILCEGGNGHNNSSLSSWLDGTVTPDVYYHANGTYLGDTGNDIVYGENHCLYITVSTSRYIVKLDAGGKELCRYSCSEAEGDPRYMALYGGDLYVSLYSGQIAKLDTADLSLKSYCAVRLRPEEIAVGDHYLYVANTEYNSSNYTYGNTVSVIDLNTFTLSREITVGTNPSRILTAQNGKVYVCSFVDFYSEDGSWIQEIDPADWRVRTVAHANFMAAQGDTLYLINSYTDYSEYPVITTRNRFSMYDLAGDSIISRSFITPLPEALTSSIIYMLAVEPESGDKYITTTDYTTNGTLYYYHNATTGSVRDAGGINPSAIIFCH